MAEPDDAAPGEYAVVLCESGELQDSGRGVSFDVRWRGQTCRAFAVRFAGRVHGYLNRCSHVAMELDWQPDRFFDASGQWLVCASHGALYAPDSGACRGGPCRGPLVRVRISEQDGVVRWHTAHDLQPIDFFE